MDWFTNLSNAQWDWQCRYTSDVDWYKHRRHPDLGYDNASPCERRLRLCPEPTASTTLRQIISPTSLSLVSFSFRLLSNIFWRFQSLPVFSGVVFINKFFIFSFLEICVLVFVNANPWGINKAHMSLLVDYVIKIRYTPCDSRLVARELRPPR